MALVELTSGVQAANSILTLPSVTPTPNALVILKTLKWAGNSADPTQETVDGSPCGLTFELVGTPVVVEPAGTSRGLLSTWIAQAAAPTAGQITVDFRASGGGGGIAWLGEDDEVPVGNNGADAVIQHLNDAEDAGGVAFEFGAEDLGVPLSSFADPANKTLVCLVLRGTATYTTTIDFDADLTEFTNLPLDDSIDWVMRCAWRSGENLTPGATWPDSAAAAAANAMEIAFEAQALSVALTPIYVDVDVPPVTASAGDAPATGPGERSRLHLAHLRGTHKARAAS